MTIVAFLPPVSAKRWMVGLLRSISAAVVGAAGEDHGIDAVVRDEFRADRATATGCELQSRFRHARSPKALAQQVGDEHGVGRRLEDDRVAGGERSGDAAAGNREWKIPGRDDDDDAPAAAADRLGSSWKYRALSA